MSIDHAGSRIVELTREESFDLVGRHGFVGRVAYVHGGRVVIRPVNYMLEGDGIVIATAAGTTLSELEGVEVVFEVDDNRPLMHGGWSVIVEGVIHRVNDAAEEDFLKRTPLRTWAWTSADRWMRIAIRTVTGRRIPET